MIILPLLDNRHTSKPLRCGIISDRDVTTMILLHRPSGPKDDGISSEALLFRDIALDESLGYETDMRVG